MTYEELKNFLKENSNIVKDLYPSLDSKLILDTAFCLIERGMNSDETPKFSEEEQNKINTFLVQTLLVIMESEISKVETDVLINISELLFNLSSCYTRLFYRPYELKILNILLGAKRSLEDSIILSSFLTKKIKETFLEETSTSLLSRKFYTEFNEFLKDKGHDTPYSV